VSPVVVFVTIIANLYFNRFFPQVHYNYSLAFEQLRSQTSRLRRHRLDALFFIQVYLGSQFCPPVFETVGLRTLLGASKTLLCSMSAPQVKIVPLLMLFAGT
jgi:hypothetical protein